MPDFKLLALMLATTIAAAGCFTPSAEKSLESAKVRMSKNDINGAIVELKNTLQNSPDNLEARYLLGKALISQGNLVAAEVELSKALDAGFEPDSVTPDIAYVNLRLGRLKKVVESYEVSDLKTPTARAQLLAIRSQALSALDDESAAKRVNSEALQLDPENTRARLNLAGFAFRESNPNEAIRILDQLLREDPKSVTALEYKAQILDFNLNNPEAAAALYRQILELDPRSVGAATALVLKALRSNDLAEAQRLLTNTRKSLPNHPQTHYLAALIALSQDQLERARDYAGQMLRAPSPPAAHLQLAGFVAAKLGGLAEAERLFTQALLLNEKDQAIRAHLARLHIQRGDAAKALSVLEPALQSSNPSSDVWAIAGQAHQTLGQHDKAQQAYSAALRKDPKDVRAHAQLAVTEVEAGQVASGITALRQLASADKSQYADLALISTHFRREEFHEALAAIDALEKKLTNPTTQTSLLRGTAELALKRQAKARAAFEKALSLDKFNMTAAASLATLDLAAERPVDASARFQRILDADPENIQAAVALISLRKATGETEASLIESVRGLIKKRPDVPAPRLLLIDYLARAGDRRGALAAAQDAHAALPDSVQLMETLAMMQAAAGEHNQAAATLNRIANRHPDSAQPLFLLAELQSSRGKKTEAIATLRRALEVQPDYLPASVLLGKILHSNRQITELKKLGKDLVSRNPRSALGHLFIGEAEASSNNWAAAASAYRSGTESAPTNVELAVKYSFSLRRLNKNSEADEFIERRIKKLPNDTIFIGAIADQALQSQQLEKALQLYQAVIKINPQDASALNNAAWIMHRLGKSEALEMAEAAVQANPTSANSLDTLATILSERGQVGRALDVQRKAVDLAKNSAAIGLNLAKVLAKNNRNQEALKELDRIESLPLGPQLRPEIQQFREKVSKAYSSNGI